MKKLILNVTLYALLAVMYSCEDKFLQVPDTTGTVNLEKVYSDSTLAMQTVVNNYRVAMTNGWGGYVTTNAQTGFWHGNIAAISGEIVKGAAWHANYAVATKGPSPVYTSGVSINSTLEGTSIVQFYKLYSAIRSNFLVIENIDKVPNMTTATKDVIKAESKGMIAYLYLYLFKSYGGVPVVTKSLEATDAPIARGTVKETLDYIVTISEEAVAGLPNSWPANLNGRLTKAAIQTTKAEALLIAARPLFNSATPYLSFGVNNAFICFGNADQTRWQDAIDAAEAALAQARTEGKEIINTGGAGVGIPNPNAIADYGTATSTPSNSELILSCHFDEDATGYYCNTSSYQPTGRYNSQYGLTRNMFTTWYKADGTDQFWPKAGDDSPRPGSDYVDKFLEMEARFRVDLIGPGIETATIVSNPGDQKWAANGWGTTLSNNKAAFPNGITGLGCALPIKFYYKAGNRKWYEYPIFRVAQLYLQLAEAYNEIGNSAKALENLNIVHNRAGLPPIVETDKTELRKLIQREWDIEFFDEGKRYFNYREWKRDDIGVGGMYGDIEEFQFQIPSGASASVGNLKVSLLSYWSAVTYSAYWNPKMYLEPFPQTEINKGTIIQNPGY